jgi:hypothetical protein
MKLTDEEQDILAGKLGPVPEQALQHQIAVGDFFGAADFVPVTQAHIMADTESLGEAGVRWLEGLAAATQGRRRVCIPTITDPRGTDFTKAAFLEHTPPMLDLERRAIAAFVKLGVTMTDTCINYQTIQAPTRNEHLAFGDTGVVIYSNACFIWLASRLKPRASPMWGPLPCPRTALRVPMWMRCNSRIATTARWMWWCSPRRSSACSNCARLRRCAMSGASACRCWR